MSKYIFGSVLCMSAALWICAAAADTIYLNNGVRVDGVVQQLPSGVYSVKAGDRSVIYRPEEVKRVEKNTKTGHFDREAAMARWKALDEELTRKTGLNAEQRRRVNALLYGLQTDREADRVALRNQLIAMQDEMDLFKYIVFKFPEMSHRLSPWVLETLAYIDRDRALPMLRENLTNSYYGTRAIAIEILGKAQDVTSIGMIARGLADHTEEVQRAAIYALAAMDVIEATPALIDMLNNPDPRLANVARGALEHLWRNEPDAAKIQSRDKWLALWEAKRPAGAKPIQLAELKPLVSEEEEFEDE